MKASFIVCSLNHLSALILIALLHTSCHSTKNATMTLQENTNTTATGASLAESASLDSFARSVAVELHDVEIVIEETSTDTIANAHTETAFRSASDGFGANIRYPKRTILRAKSISISEDGKATRATIATQQQNDSITSEQCVRSDLSDNRTQTKVFAPPDKWSWLIAFVIVIIILFLYLKYRR